EPGTIPSKPRNGCVIISKKMSAAPYRTSHVRNVGIPPKFYLPGICLGGSQSAVAARFLVVVPYGVGLSLQIEVRKLALNPEFEKVKGPWLFTSQRPFW
ncbi:hypothetical protein, partial [Bifidobacterium longum]|uniref:hypothetical protein n=1 Tax=Bifidobacterium longum TaxID=216816 RepID=UPI003568845F